MSDTPSKMSEVNKIQHGIDPRDIISNRKAGDWLVKQAAKNGNKIALMSENLNLLARMYGIDSNYIEDIDADEVY